MVEGDLDLDKLNYTMGALLQIRGEDIYRMKGILAIDGSEHRCVVFAYRACCIVVPRQSPHEGHPGNGRLRTPVRQSSEARIGWRTGIMLLRPRTVTNKVNNKIII